MASTDTTAAQQTLYDYWRTLLMEEEKNAVRNERLLRKLEDIEQRTNLLYHRTERLSQLRRRFAEMLRQQYLNDSEFDCERYPYEFKITHYVEPSYEPDPVLFGLDTPPWMPRENDYDPTIQRSRNVIETLNNCDTFSRSGSRTRFKPPHQACQEEKKDAEKDSEKDITVCGAETVDGSDALKIQESLDEEEQRPTKVTDEKAQGSVGTDEREDEINDDLQEIDRKVNEIDREIERLEIEVRDREVLRQKEVEEKERCRRRMEDQGFEEGNRLEEFQKGRADIRLEAFSREEQHRDQEESPMRRVEELRKENEICDNLLGEGRLKRKLREERSEEDDLCTAEERRRREQINVVKHDYEDHLRKRDVKDMEQIEQGDTHTGELEEDINRKFDDSKDFLRKSIEVKKRPEHVIRNGKKNQDSSQKVKRKVEQDGKQTRGGNSNEQHTQAPNPGGDDDFKQDRVNKNVHPIPDTAPLSYVEEETEFYRTTSELEENQVSAVPTQTTEGEQTLKLKKNTSEGEMTLREVPKSGQHTPKHNVIEPGPGILKNGQPDTLGVSRNLFNQRRPSFIPRRSSSAMAVREKDPPFALPLVPFDYRSAQTIEKRTRGGIDIDANNIQQGTHQGTHQSQEMMNNNRESAGQDTSDCSKRKREANTPGNKSSWQKSWEENTKEKSSLEQRGDDVNYIEDSAQRFEHDESRANLIDSRRKESIAEYSKYEHHESHDGTQNETGHLSLRGYEPPVAINMNNSSIYDGEVVPTVLSSRTIKSRRLAEAEKEMKLNALAKTLQTELRSEILQRQPVHAGIDPTEFVSHYSCYLPSTSVHPNVNVKRFQRDIHTPNLEELNIQKTSQVLISGIHGATESGCSDSSLRSRKSIESISSTDAAQSSRCEAIIPLQDESNRRNSSQVLLDANQEIADTDENKAKQVPRSNTFKENETSSRSDSPSSSVELNCSKDDCKDSRGEYSMLMGKKLEDSPKPTALPLPPPSRRTSMQNQMTTGILADGDRHHKPHSAENQTKNSPHLDKSEPTAEQESWQAFSKESSPLAYASEYISAHHVRELITNNVKHHVPNIVAKRVLGLDLFSSDAPRPKDSDPEEDSFFD